MKKLILFALFCSSLQLFSQDKTMDEAINMMAEDTCECIKNDPESFKPEISMDKKKMSLGLCLLKSYNVRKNESTALAKNGLNNFEQIGEQVGLKLVEICMENFMGLFSSNDLEEFVNDDDDDSYGTMPPPPPPPALKNENDLQMEGDLISLNNDAISYIQIKDAYNKTHLFLICEQFEGFELLKKSNYQKSFKVYYKESYYFDLSERKYVKKKVVKHIEFL
ncbi:hypothetical protein M0G43_10080 [Subsaxibacter sp. CAU 1640]|uniref:hypothetical protein n=1 Tax=Subsaxibacter sp. CAU 1640 TaxID=2933271 RepID=UPI002003F4E6|nr:hypothetical protein [Subsaxibacter sp. CAU 1640]MCK7590919.1 hypothetical protein [Subsaxibacter sp. CAU 1640]